MSESEQNKSDALIGVALLSLDVFVMFFSIVSAVLLLWNISDKTRRMSVVNPQGKKSESKSHTKG